MRVVSHWEAGFIADPDPEFLARFRRWMPARIVDECAPAVGQEQRRIGWTMVHEGETWEQFVVDLISAAQAFASTVDARLQLAGSILEEVLINLDPRPGGVLVACNIDVVTCELHRADLPSA